MEESGRLIFFDTFSHEINEDINLDLVQFPKPVYITEIRIIPLGARVQADFPGGVRLGATNPSKFGIEFFVNDLGKPGASSFERLGNLEYNQNNCINLECHDDKIPTDGLVLRGWYTTITLAVYGTLSKNLSEQIASPPATPTELHEQTEEILPEPIEILDDAPYEIKETNNFEEPPTAEARNLYADDNYYSNQESGAVVSSSQRSRKKSRSSEERSLSRNRTYSSSNEYGTNKKREWSRSPEYSSSGRHARRIRGSRHDSDSHGEHSKRPRSPFASSPPRPQSPDEYECEDFIRGKGANQKLRTPIENAEDPVESIQLIDDDGPSEQFEPILSDDEILGEDDSQGMTVTATIDPEDIEMEELMDYETHSKHFDPFKIPLLLYKTNLNEMCVKDMEIMRKMLTKFNNHFKFSSPKEFLLMGMDDKELFVNLCETFINQLNHIGQYSLKKRNFIMSEIFKCQREHLNIATTILKLSLNFDCACSQSQPGYKIRHIKIGPRLVELILSCSKDLLQHYCEIERADPFKNLFELFLQQHMALSIKLIILRSIYSMLDNKFGLKIFIHSKINGYQHLLVLLQNNPQTRVKFAIKSIIKKINLFEALEMIRDLCSKLFVLTNCPATEDDYIHLSICLEEVKKAISTEAFSFQQPKRCLPVSNQFEIIKDQAAWKSWANMLQSYFKEHSLCESLLLIMCNQNEIPAQLLTVAMNLLNAMTKSQTGLDYFVDDAFECTQLIVKCLLGLDEDNDESSENEVGTTTEDVGEKCSNSDKSDAISTTIQSPKDDTKEKSPEIDSSSSVRVNQNLKLGFEMAFKIQTRYHIDAIISNKDNIDVLCDHLYSLYSQTTISYQAKIFTTEVLGFNGNLNPFLNIIEKERKIQSKRQQDSPGVKYKSPSLSLSVDILDCYIRNCSNLEYLIDHYQILSDLVKNHEIFESSVSAVLQEMAVYLKPLELVQNFSYNDITPICDVIKRSIEYITTFPGDLIMGLRILQHLCVDYTSDIAVNHQTKELKLRYVMLQFYSVDGVLSLLSILEKLNSYFEQPGLHSATLITIQGIHLCEVLLPTLRILKEILTFLIKCRDTQFKDLTAIEPLLKTYTLMYYFPESSQAYDDSLQIREEIIKIFLAYTQPNEEEEELVHKSLWTQMIREVIKYIIQSPSTFMPGLKILAELIPLPLPIPTLKPLTDEECQRYITERKLWSAHLHPDSIFLTEMIQTICPTAFPQLLDLLTRVCLQLADLAPNMTLLISKTVTDLITAEFVQNSVEGIGTQHLARLLNFLAQLTVYPSVKISTLSIFPGKLYECFICILNSTDKSSSNLLCQTNILRILETFFDSEISMINTGIYSENLELNLSSALPPRDVIPELINSIFNNLISSHDVSNPACQAGLRNMVLLTEHDITFFFLRQNMMNKKVEFQGWLIKFIDYLEKSMNKGHLANFVLFLRNLVVVDETLYATVPVRNLSFSLNELRELLNWSVNASALKKLKSILETDETNNPEALLPDVCDLLEKLNCPPDQVESLPTEPSLPQSEGIVTLYLSRPVYTICENLDDVQLNSNYWLEPIRLEEMPSISSTTDLIQSNLSELIKNCLPPETNLSSECKRVLHLSASPQSRERMATAPCFRTRRVEVEPQTGRPEKKIYISPMRGRGFARAPPSRGDLFRSRPPNTSRPPSLHVDDFLALETCGAQPTGPTGYNKLSRDIIGIRGARGRGRARIGIVGGVYRKPFRGAPSQSYGQIGSTTPQHFRAATSEPVKHFGADPHYPSTHFGTPIPRGRGRGRARIFFINK